MNNAITNDFEDELDAIRLQIYEEVKDMTPEEFVAYSIAQAEPVMKQYNMKRATLESLPSFKRSNQPNFAKA